jgi:hypothetical protein
MNRYPAFRKATWAVLLVTAGALLAGCPSPPPESGHATDGGPLGDFPLLTFEPHVERFLTRPQPLSLPAGTTVRGALEALSRHLAGTYFTSPADTVGAIRLDVLALHQLPLGPRNAWIAVIDLVDPEQIALEQFFQGSAGGQTTYCMLAATLLQPQHHPPLVDGLIVLYNGGEFPQLDHIDLTGIVTPGPVRRMVAAALQRGDRSEAAAD